VPRYQRITGLLARHGCHLAWTDCDGNIMPVVDSFLAGGINVMFPVEVNGGSDPVAMRRRWPGLRMQGGFCKMRLAEGRTAIRAEFERLQPMVREGGFVPGVDHRVQADVGYDDYRFYLKLKRDLLGVGGVPQYDESTI
jgi:uroporphyrinogen decarboxylase